jgi:hypothetical protein
VERSIPENGSLREEVIGEQRWIPMVRQAAGETLIVAGGFGCKRQIREGTDRQSLHLAQVLRMALHEARAARWAAISKSDIPACGCTARGGSRRRSARHPSWGSAHF